MATFSSTPIASEYCQVRVGGDVAALKGVMKLVLEAHEAAVRSGGEPVIDLPFIERHTFGFEALSEDLRRTSWDDILRVSGLQRPQIERVAQIYMQAKSVHHLLRHGPHPAPLRHGERPADRQSAHAARQYWPARHRHLSRPRPFQRAGRPDGWHRRKAPPGTAEPDRESLRLPPASAPREGGGGYGSGDPRRPHRRVYRSRRQLRRGGPGREDRERRDAATEADRRHQYEAEPRPYRAWPGSADPALPGEKRHRHAGDRPSKRDGGGQHVDGACVGRPRDAAEPQSQIRSVDRVRHGARDLARQRD